MEVWYVDGKGIKGKNKKVNDRLKGGGANA
jgi:hypothetical protein